MPIIKGVPQKTRLYDFYSFCCRCNEWWKDKPIRCPDCGNQTRSKSRVKKLQVLNFR